MAENFSEPSICLVTHAQHHLAFLQEVDSIAVFLEKPNVIAKAVQRYETCWLPLLSAHRDEDLLPPLDVHWAWHVHMLCPQQYTADVTKIVGNLVDHKFHLLREDRQSAEYKTRNIWCSMFPNEPYKVDFENIPANFAFSFPSMAKVDYDIQAASSRQLQFYYNVSLPHFGLVPFLEEARTRYMKFIYLKSQNKEAFLVPMYDIDLMWHTHQLSPAAYDKDCKSWLGYVLNHDDTTTDRSPGSHLNSSYANTWQLWRETFKEEYAIPGVGYRGPQPRGKLYKMSAEEINDYKGKTARVRLDSLNYVHHKKTNKLKGSLKSIVRRGYNQEVRNIDLPMVNEEPFTWKNDLPSGLCVFDMVPEATCDLKLHLKSYKGLLSPLINGGKVFKSVLQVTDELRKAVDQGLTAATVSREYSNQRCRSCVELSFTIADPKIITDDAEFTLDEKAFTSEAVMPETIEAMWGPVYLPRLPEGVDNVCQVADHRLLSNNGPNVTVRIIHSLSLRMSVVQIFYQDKLAAISHLIGQEQLPSPNQVSPDAHKWMTLDLKKGERAMLVKNHYGDWAIIKGRWDRKSKTSPGHLKVDVKLLGRDQHSSFKVLEDKLHNFSGWNLKDNFKFMKSKINLITDELTINCYEYEMVENIATIFSALVLYSLCEPRRGDKPGADRKANAAKVVRGRRQHPSQYKYMRAAGYMEDTPSNSYLWWLWYMSLSTSDHECHGEVDFQYPGDMVNEGCDVADGENPVFCPWDPNGESNPADLVSDFVGDTSDVAAGSCGSCGTGTDHGNSGWSSSDHHDSGFSSCASSGGAGSSCASSGGAGSSCASSGGAGSSCASSGGGGSSCGSSGGSSCGGD